MKTITLLIVCFVFIVVGIKIHVSTKDSMNRRFDSYLMDKHMFYFRKYAESTKAYQK